MWFLWAVVAFLVVMFSTSQLISYIICFMRYPELMKDIPDRNKNMIIGGLVLHSSINLIWVVLICSISAIGQHYIAIIISTILALIFSISGIRSDPNLYQNFKKLTGVEDRERIEEQLTNYVNKIKESLPTNRIKNSNSESILFEDSDDEDDVKGDETLDFREKKRIEFEKKFRRSFDGVLASQETIICNKKTTVYSFSPTLANFGDVGSFTYLVEVGKIKPRYFALEASYDMTFLLCEWKFKENGQHQHIIHCTLINGITEMIGTKNGSIYDRLVKKIKEIMEAELKN